MVVGPEDDEEDIKEEVRCSAVSTDCCIAERGTGKR